MGSAGRPRGFLRGDFKCQRPDLQPIEMLEFAGFLGDLLPVQRRAVSAAKVFDVKPAFGLFQTTVAAADEHVGRPQLAFLVPANRKREPRDWNTLSRRIART